MFRNRKEAGLLLAKKLRHLKNQDVVIAAIPKGGIPVGFVVAKELELPLEIVLSKKIVHPYERDYAIGEVSLKSRVLGEVKNVPTGYIEKATKRIRALLKEVYRKYSKRKKPISFEDKTVIVIDDGVATGNTILSTVKLLEAQKAKRIIVAVPIIASHAIQIMESSPLIDELIWILSPANYKSIDQFYQDFKQVSQEKASHLLRKANKPKKVQTT